MLAKRKGSGVCGQVTSTSETAWLHENSKAGEVGKAINAHDSSE